MVDLARSDVATWTIRDCSGNLTGLVVLGSIGALGMGLFGMLPLSLHSPLHYMGIMDPLCGMTRAVMSFSRFDLVAAWAYNPGSYLLALAGGLLLVRAVYGLASGQWFNLGLLMPSGRRGRIALLVGVVAGVAVLWLNQQAHVDLLY